MTTQSKEVLEAVIRAAEKAETGYLYFQGREFIDALKSELTGEEKWSEQFEKYRCLSSTEEAIPVFLQEHTERIIKEIEGRKISVDFHECFGKHCLNLCCVHNNALDAVINHLKKGV